MGNKKYNKTNEILTEIKKRIEDRYEIIEMDFYKDKKEMAYSKLSFKLVTPYYNVPIEIRRDYNYKYSMHISFKFKKERPQRRGGIISGYAPSIYHSYADNGCDYIDEIKFDTIYREMDDILSNIKEDGTWCDESRFDD